MRKIEDLSGKIFGNTEVLNLAGQTQAGSALWNCRCSCGNLFVKRAYVIKKSRTGTCFECMCKLMSEKQRLKLEGKRFGKLEVISLAHIKKVENTSYAYFNCKCDCGKETVIKGGSLISKGTRSCGCGRWKERGVAAFNQVVYRYKKAAERRKLSFLLSTTEFFDLSQQVCFYCGSPPSNIKRIPSKNGEFIYNGIDRIDNSKGYYKKNCVSCCELCNGMKSGLTREAFLSHVAKIGEWK